MPHRAAARTVPARQHPAAARVALPGVWPDRLPAVARAGDRGVERGDQAGTAAARARAGPAVTVPFIDRPVAGHYQMRLARGGVFVAVRFWFGAPVFDGEVLDRSPRWCVEVNGQTTRPVYDDDGNDTGQRELLDPFEVWPVAGG